MGQFLFFKWNDKPIKEVLLRPLGDRRLLPNVPDPEGLRKTSDRRGSDVPVTSASPEKASGTRYLADFPVKISELKRFRPLTIHGENVDISQTGILIKFSDPKVFNEARAIADVKLNFKIPPGAMQEGMESRISIEARQARVLAEKNAIAYEFQEPLARFLMARKDRVAFLGATLMLGFVSFFIILMRAESIIYFRFNKIMHLYSIVTAFFLLSRYLFGALYKPVKVDRGYTPSVTIIIPCFNEEEWIHRTILSAVDQDYPIDKLNILIIDDRSTDRSVEEIRRTIDELNASEDYRFHTSERVTYYVQEKNGGKREALAKGTELAPKDCELMVFVDSDSFIEPDAIRNLVQPFRDPQIAGVAGRTDVANTYTNTLTKLQSVRYYISFRVMKAAEAYFDAVTCLSGPLACYRKSEVERVLDPWLKQRFLGQRATFGDDRSLTNFMLRNNRTGYQDTAIVSTIVPSRHKTFLKQQMRWKRSWLRETAIAASFIWRKEPFMALFFYMGFAVPILAPIIVLFNLVYIPWHYKVFPTTFLVGLLMMSMMMSLAQLFFKKSSIWLYGAVFCLYYEVVLLWQMPIAWFTFWKSTWGTRMTPEDVKEAEKKKQKQTEKAKHRKGKQSET